MDQSDGSPPALHPFLRRDSAAFGISVCRLGLASRGNSRLTADDVLMALERGVSAAATLGASRRRIILRVVLPHSWPGIVGVARINLAAGWLMLVVAELLASDEGLAVRIARATRFQDFDVMFAVLIVFGAIGVLSDLALRGLRWAVAPWDR